MNKNSMFTRLFESVCIGTMEIRNRIVMPAMATNLADDDGFVTDRMRSYYAARAEGGCGLVIVEYACINAPEGQAMPCALRIDDDKFVSGLATLAQAVKTHGARVAVQIQHAGSRAGPSITRQWPVAPSAVRAPGHEIPRELTVSEIERIVVRFAEAAERAKRAGFDGVEIHAASDVLINNFLSRAANKRHDGYGGSLENRARILTDIVHAIKESAGRDYPTWCRINGVEWGIKDGITIEESRMTSQMVERAGIDAIHVKDHAAPSHLVLSLSPPPGNLIPQVAAIKSAVKVPVIASGRISVEMAEQLLREGKADLISMGRAQIADPELANKAAEGRLDDVRPCIACMRCAENAGEKMIQIACSVNATAGRERRGGIALALEKKKIVVIGGGPAGMEAARVAALRGHKVILYERAVRLGGQLMAASIAPNKRDIKPFITYLEGQIRKLGVDARCKEEATAALLMAEKPDVVVLATGAMPLIPEIPGVDQSRVVPAVDVLTGRMRVGNNVIVLGGGMVGCEVAEVLADEGKDVTIIEMLDRVGIEIMGLFRRPTLNRLVEKKVRILTKTRCKEITTEGVVVIVESEEKVIAADNVVIAAGSKANRDLLRGIGGDVRVYLAGDCIQPRKILEAVEDGFIVGCSL